MAGSLSNNFIIVAYLMAKATTAMPATSTDDTPNTMYIHIVVSSLMASSSTENNDVNSDI